MTKLRTIGFGLAGIAALAVLVVAFPFSRKAVFCSEIVNPYDLIGSYVVFVPAADHGAYDRAFLEFAGKHGFGSSSGEERLAEAGGGSRMFRNLNSTACDGSTLIWSSNVAHPDEFVVTFHSNRLTGRKRAAAIERAFLAEFSGRYRIRPERDVARERGY